MTWRGVEVCKDNGPGPLHLLCLIQYPDHFRAEVLCLGGGLVAHSVRALQSMAQVDQLVDANRRHRQQCCPGAPHELS